MLRTIALAATCAAIGLVAAPVAAQPVFDNMKCYKIKDNAPGKTYTADLVPKLTHDFATELGFDSFIFSPEDRHEVERLAHDVIPAVREEVARRRGT